MIGKGRPEQVFLNSAEEYENEGLIFAFFPQRVKKGLGSFWRHRERSATGASDQFVGRPERFGRPTSNDMAAVYLPMSLYFFV
jgi:hypothetical protein